MAIPAHRFAAVVVIVFEGQPVQKLLEFRHHTPGNPCGPMIPNKAAKQFAPAPLSNIAFRSADTIDAARSNNTRWSISTPTGLIITS
jgi:hypothetical protein